MKSFIFPFLLLLITPQSFANDCVILLHGLARSAKSMDKMAETLQKKHYTVVNHDYPSTRYTVEILAEQVIPEAVSQCPGDAIVNFVTHSMGGILIRQYLAVHELDKLGRVVMLGPPNKGSQVVDKFSRVPGYYMLNGPAGMQLGTKEDSVPNQLGPANFDLGIIAGTRSINLILSSVLPNPDDGKVSVENTKLAGMDDHISLPVTHPMMMKNETVIEQVIYFLKEGQFNKESN